MQVSLLRTRLTACQQEVRRLTELREQEGRAQAQALAAAKAKAGRGGDRSSTSSSTSADGAARNLLSKMRLSVIAPVINITTGGGGVDTAGRSDALHGMKPKMPAAQVRSVVEQDILPRFARLYVQGPDGDAGGGGGGQEGGGVALLGPDGAPLEQFLQDMQQRMCGNLQAQLKDVFA
jgi:hypothetical protein